MKIEITKKELLKFYESLDSYGEVSFKYAKFVFFTTENLKLISEEGFNIIKDLDKVGNFLKYQKERQQLILDNSELDINTKQPKIINGRVIIKDIKSYEKKLLTLKNKYEKEFPLFENQALEVNKILNEKINIEVFKSTMSLKDIPEEVKQKDFLLFNKLGVLKIN